MSLEYESRAYMVLPSPEKVTVSVGRRLPTSSLRGGASADQSQKYTPVSPQMARVFPSGDSVNPPYPTPGLTRRTSARVWASQTRTST